MRSKLLELNLPDIKKDELLKLDTECKIPLEKWVIIQAKNHENIIEVILSGCSIILIE